MKIALLSDIHGNARALKAVLNDLKAKQIHTMYILGDICYRGPDPKNSLETVRSLPAKVLKGNADEWIVRGVRKDEVPDPALAIMNQERDWALERLTEDDLIYLDQLPVFFHDKLNDYLSMHAFHAVPDNLFEVVAANTLEQEMEMKLTTAADANIYVYAHIHTPFIKKIGSKTIINTGSVGLPFDGNPRPSYVLLDIDGPKFEASIERVDYDKDRVIKQYEANDYPNRELMKHIIQNGKRPE
ncbi:metallophosphoesterase family protein [Alteribacillus sp. HJP-4]|uniref:metallophosphoesterase family protein n=1 Tax=Alteribacillus sp. HJP-4 TaxID=2775394 RepID=UPI0035CCE941